MQNAPREHSAILSTFIKLPFVFKTIVLSIFEWPLKTGFTVVGFSVHGKVKLYFQYINCVSDGRKVAGPHYNLVRNRSMERPYGSTYDLVKVCYCLVYDGQI